MADELNVFERAAEVIREKGWAQAGGGFDINEGPFCIALAIGVGVDGLSVSAAEHLVRSLDLSTFGEVWRWNDDPSRTEEDVLLALKHAAATWTGD